jgi:hypothetical protein
MNPNLLHTLNLESCHRYKSSRDETTAILLDKNLKPFRKVDLGIEILATKPSNVPIAVADFCRTYAYIVVTQTGL